MTWCSSAISPDQIDERALIDSLPATYKPVVRYPQFYGLSGRDMGLQFRFRYQLVYKTRSFENQFFSFLAHTGTEGPLTAFQEQYNQQNKNVLDVTGPVLYIDAPSVERYLSSRDGGDSRGYTIYFINWYAGATSSSTSIPRPTKWIPTPITTSASSAPHAR